jgi:hypothetical protein
MLIDRPKSRIVMIGAWALDLLWAPLFLGGKSPVDIIAAIGFLCSTVVCVIAQGVYQGRKAAGPYEDLSPLPWRKQIW